MTLCDSLRARDDKRGPRGTLLRHLRGKSVGTESRPTKATAPLWVRTLSGHSSPQPAGTTTSSRCCASFSFSFKSCAPLGP